MTVTFDNLTAGAQTSTVSFTVALTVAANAVLLVGVVGRGSASAITYNNVALTRLVQTKATGNNIKSEIWGLATPQAAGAHNIVAKVGGGAALTWQICGNSFINAATSNQFTATTSATASAISVLISVSSQATDMIFASLACQGAISSASNLTNTLRDGSHVGALFGSAAGAAPTMSVSAILQTSTISNTWAMALVNVTAPLGGRPLFLRNLMGVGF